MSTQQTPSDTNEGKNTIENKNEALSRLVDSSIKELAAIVEQYKAKIEEIEKRGHKRAYELNTTKTKKDAEEPMDQEIYKENLHVASQQLKAFYNADSCIYNEMHPLTKPIRAFNNTFNTLSRDDQRFK